MVRERRYERQDKQGPVISFGREALRNWGHVTKGDVWFFSKGGYDQNYPGGGKFPLISGRERHHFRDFRKGSDSSPLVFSFLPGGEDTSLRKLMYLLTW